MELYSYVPPPGANIPVSEDPLPLENLVPTEDEINGAEKLLCNHPSGGPSKVQDKHLKGLLAAARKKEK